MALIQTKNKDYIEDINKYIILNISIPTDKQEEFLSNLMSGKEFYMWIGNVGSAEEGNKIYNSINDYTGLPAKSCINIDLTFAGIGKLKFEGNSFVNENLSLGYVFNFFGYLESNIYAKFIAQIYINGYNDPITLHINGIVGTIGG